MNTLWTNKRECIVFPPFSILLRLRVVVRRVITSNLPHRPFKACSSRVAWMRMKMDGWNLWPPHETKSHIPIVQWQSNSLINGLLPLENKQQSTEHCDYLTTDHWSAESSWTARQLSHSLSGQLSSQTGQDDVCWPCYLIRGLTGWPIDRSIEQASKQTSHAARCDTLHYLLLIPVASSSSLLNEWNKRRVVVKNVSSRIDWLSDFESVGLRTWDRKRSFRCF